ncbi:MAG: deoxyribose-phosphate aldolase, partial [Flavobacteriales bacterium]|nr:deoxyribose-phosphate aldolase [Flavobacteriales bacterium]
MSCNQKPKELTAKDILDKTIEVAGGERYDNAEIDFTFRNIKYKSIRQNGRFSLQRFLPDTLNTVDILTNDRFTRLQKNEKIVLADTTTFKYMESVNSVH